MNRGDADQILAILAAPHGWTIESDTKDVWYQAALERCDAELATAIAVRLVESEERFPTPARFNKERAAVERERYLASQQEQPALPSMPTPESERAGHLAQMRAALAPLGRKGTRGHDHHGPMPCPVCGGMNPTVLAELDPDARLRADLAREAILSDQRHRFGPRI